MDSPGILASQSIFGLLIIVLAIVVLSVGVHKSLHTSGRQFDICIAQNANANGLYLPQAGTLNGACLQLNNYRDILVFRSQMTDINGNRQEFPRKNILKNIPSSQPQDIFKRLVGYNQPQTLQSQQDAYLLNLPWPPEASAQLVTYQSDPELVNGTVTTQNVLQYLTTASANKFGVAPALFPPLPNDPVPPGVSLTTPEQRQQQQSYVNSLTQGLRQVSCLPYPNNAKPFALIAGISLPDGSDAQSQQSVSKQVTNRTNGTFDTQNTSQTQVLSHTQLQKVQIQFLDQGVVYVELAGGSGGHFVTGNLQKDPLAVEFQGGTPGIVWAQMNVKRGDTWFIQLAQDGGAFPNTALAITEDIPVDNSLPSFGGSGSYLSGSEGGGLTQVSSAVPNTLRGPSPATGDFGEGSAEGVLIAAGGGGGASRNGLGGSAGSSLSRDEIAVLGLNTEDPNFQGTKHPNPINQGFPGGPVNILNLNELPKKVEPPQHQSCTRQDLSGGGGATNTFGHSQTINELKSFGVPPNAASIIKTTTQGRFLAGGNGSNDPPGGGGGGAGQRGGGAGTWNGRAAPNNLHGAGGGGSSYVSPSQQRTSSFAEIPNGNPFQGYAAKTANVQVNQPGSNSQGGAPINVPKSPVVFKPTSYFMIGLPVQG